MPTVVEAFRFPHIREVPEIKIKLCYFLDIILQDKVVIRDNVY